MLLRIIKAEFFLVRIPLRFSVEHALASRTANTTGFVVLTAEDGSLGIGEFLCREYVTGETLEDCLHCLKQIAPLLARSIIENPIPLIQSLWDSSAGLRGKYATICAIELALFDLWGKHQGKPVAEILCPGAWWSHQTFVYSAVYPFASGLKLLALHLFYCRLMRLTHVKVKGTGDIEKDLAYVQEIRRSFPYPVQARLDLNGSLSPNRADEYFSRMLKSKDGVTWF